MEFATHKTGRLLGSGKRADVYEYGDLALKLYQPGISKGPAFREAANLAVLEALFLPTPAVHAVGECHGRWGILMDRAPYRRFADQMDPAAPASLIETMAGLHRRIHIQHGHGLPSLTARLSANIRRVDWLDAAARARLLRQLETLPDGNRVCHGDFHPGNIHRSRRADRSGLAGRLRRRPRGRDVCRTYVVLHHVSPAWRLTT